MFFFFCRFGYPAFLALNPKDAKFANLRESFDKKNAVTFIEQLRSVSLTL